MSKASNNGNPPKENIYDVANSGNEDLYASVAEVRAAKNQQNQYDVGDEQDGDENQYDLGNSGDNTNDLNYDLANPNEREGIYSEVKPVNKPVDKDEQTGFYNNTDNTAGDLDPAEFAAEIQAAAEQGSEYVEPEEIFGNKGDDSIYASINPETKSETKNAAPPPLPLRKSQIEELSATIHNFFDINNAQVDDGDRAQTISEFKKILDSTLENQAEQNEAARNPKIASFVTKFAEQDSKDPLSKAFVKLIEQTGVGLSSEKLGGLLKAFEGAHKGMLEIASGGFSELGLDNPALFLMMAGADKFLGEAAKVDEKFSFLGEVRNLLQDDFKALTENLIKGANAAPNQEAGAGVQDSQQQKVAVGEDEKDDKGNGQKVPLKDYAKLAGAAGTMIAVAVVAPYLAPLLILGGLAMWFIKSSREGAKKKILEQGRVEIKNNLIAGGMSEEEALAMMRGDGRNNIDLEKLLGAPQQDRGQIFGGEENAGAGTEEERAAASKGGKENAGNSRDETQRARDSLNGAKVDLKQAGDFLHKASSLTRGGKDGSQASNEQGADLQNQQNVDNTQQQQQAQASAQQAQQDSALALQTQQAEQQANAAQAQAQASSGQGAGQQGGAQGDAAQAQNSGGVLGQNPLDAVGAAVAPTLEAANAGFDSVPEVAGAGAVEDVQDAANFLGGNDQQNSEQVTLDDVEVAQKKDNSVQVSNQLEQTDEAQKGQEQSQSQEKGGMENAKQQAASAAQQIVGAVADAVKLDSGNDKDASEERGGKEVGVESPKLGRHGSWRDSFKSKAANNKTADQSLTAAGLDNDAGRNVDNGGGRG